ncbi:stalk domain-containing protein [Paenibacillus sp. strain BS8-2]
MSALSVLSVALLTPAGAATAAEATAVSAANSTYDIVVLGDSLAAGYQMGFTEKSVPYGFAEHIFEQALFHGLRADYVNYGVIGLRTEGLAAWIEASAAGKAVTEADVQPGLSDKDPRTEQIFADWTGSLAGDLRNAETVLVSIGGNDFLGLVNELGTATDVNSLPANEKAQLTTKLDALINNYIVKLDGILNTIDKLQPNAEVVIGNQYLPLPTIVLNGKVNYVGVKPSTALFLKEGQTKLNTQLVKLVKEHTDQGELIKISDAAAAIENNIRTYTTIAEGDIHPTEKGYEALGKAYAQQLWGAFKTVQPRKTGVPISVVVNGKEILSDYAPVIKNDRTFLAVRDITEAMGAKLDWNAKTSTATITVGGSTVVITVGAKTIMIDGQTIPLKADPAYLQQFPATKGKPAESKTYLPLAALSEALGFQVEYRHEKRIAFINS